MTEGVGKDEYFEPEYVESRHRVVEEMRALGENLPEPATNWDSIYVFSGPEITLDQEPDNKLLHRPEAAYNETRQRLLTGFDVARSVTALRLEKDRDKVTPEDISSSGPTVYFDGYRKHNDHLKSLQDQHKLTEEFMFPDDKLFISGNGTFHTGDQIYKFPKQAMPEGNSKVVLVSDLYHLPRIRRYIGSMYDKLHIPVENVVLYPAQPQQVPVGKALREAKIIHKYKKLGNLSED